VDDAACIVVGSESAVYRGATVRLAPAGDAVRPQRRDPPGVKALAAGGPRGLAVASLP
jgi:hypothetical protein